MGIPIPVIEVDADRARSNICLAADCQCPECCHRHIIRQTSRQGLHNFSSAAPNTTTTGATATATHSGYIGTPLPDYRFRHSLSHDPTTLGDNRHDAYSLHNNSDNSSERRGSNHYSTSALLNRRRVALGHRGPPLPQILSSSSASVSNFLSPSFMMGMGMGMGMGVGVGDGGDGGGGIGGSREPFTMSPISMVDSVQDQELHLEYEQEQWPGGEEGARQLEVEFEATLEDQPHNQHPYQFQPQSRHRMHQRPPPSSPLMRMRARAQEWASRVDGVDYYHDSDPEDLQVAEGGGRSGRQREERRERWMRRHAGGGRGESHRGIMDRHERSSSDVGIEQSTIR